MKKRCLGQKGFTLGELVVIIAIVFAIVVLLEPFARDIRARAERVECANNIRELGKALYLYAKEHQGKFPGTLEVLYKEKYLGDVRFVDCPATKHVGTPEEPEYSYKGELSVNDPSREVLLMDGEGSHRNGANMLLVDGEIMWQAEAPSGAGK